MHLEKAKTLLDKLLSQVTQLQKGEEEPSSLERDLLLMYTRQLYDAFLTEEEAAPAERLSPQSETPKSSEKKSSFSFKSFTETEKNSEAAQHLEAQRKEQEAQAERQRQQEEAARKAREEAERKAKEAAEREAQAERERQAQAEKERLAEAERKAQEETQLIETETPRPEEPAPKAQNFQEDYDELFAFEQATDLSQKLSQSPVKNLRKGLGINDKMLYGQELFGGNVGKLHDTLDALNELENMEAARAYLETEVLPDFDWTAKDKKRFARDFLKYIRRRY